MEGEVQFEGLAWIDNIFGTEPKWTVEPDVKAIEQTIQSLRPSSTVQVTFLVQGGFNKIYDVNIDNEVFIMRVSLPVDPYYKTMSEVSTVHWISRKANIPLPQIITYQSSRDNPIGFEWILMTKMPGNPVGDLWRSLPFSAKTGLVEAFADYASCLFRNQLQGIGNIFEAPFTHNSTVAKTTWPAGNSAHSVKSTISARDDGPGVLPDVDSPGDASSDVHSPDVRRIVGMHLFWGSNILQDVPRGPFGSSKDWIASRLSLSEKDCESTLKNLPSGELERRDKNKTDDATRTLEIVRKLQTLLPTVFPSTEDHPEPSIMVHDDLSSQNILVNDAGDLTAVLDWECVSALPVWKACDYPEFLKDKTRQEKPEVGHYELGEDGEPTELYWEHLLDYEVTLLRDVFIEKMKILEPAWVDVFNTSERQRDFDIAVENCDKVFAARHIRAWVDDITAGVDSPRSLCDRIDGV